MAVSTEGRFLKDLTRAFFSADDRLPVAPAGLDWHRLITLVQEHEVAASLLPLIDRNGLPEAVDRALDRTAAETQRRTTLLLLELERILPALAEADCKPILLKGVPLALTAYEQPIQRHFQDIDILVDHEKVQPTCETLQRLGYHLMTSQRDPRWYRDYHFHWVMQNDAGTIIEVHWDLTLRESIYGTDLQRLFEAAAPMDIGKSSALVPGVEDILLHMVLQAISAGFTSLKHIIDGGLLVTKIEDWPRLAARARAYNLSTGLWFLLQMVDEITGVQAPAAALRDLRPDRLSCELWSKLQQSDLCLDRLVARSHSYHFFLHWLCAPNTRLRLREIVRYIVPNEGGLLEAGYSSEAWPGPWRRFRLSLSRLKNFFGILRLGLYWASHPLRHTTVEDTG